MKQLDLTDLKAAARGRWPEIHAALGVPPEYLRTRKHSPCPYCGGRDRYRYTDYKGSGGFICNQCTPEGGSGFDLLMLVFGCDFAKAMQDVAAVLGLNDRAPQPQRPRLPPPAPAKPESDRLPYLLMDWTDAMPLTGSDPASRYLRGRGLPDDVIRDAAHIRMTYAPLYVPYAGATVRVGVFPAMLAAIMTPDGQLQGLHRTYFEPEADAWGVYHKLNRCSLLDGEPIPAKKMKARFSGSLKGAAVHLAEPDAQGRLIVAEGIETALAASALFGMPAVAALSAYGMAAFQWPPECKALFIVADNDANGTGMKAAHDLAVRAIKAGLRANIWQPPNVGEDALDEYRRRQSVQENEA